MVSTPAGIRLALCWLLALPTLLAADVIVLKNGRRIEAASVEERGDRVYWESEAGRLSVPKRLVERIERGDAPLTSPRLVEKLPLAVAPLEEGVPGDVIVDGQVNRERVAQLENQASQGDASAKLNAAAAHAVIAQHLSAEGNAAGAVASLERALVFAPNHPRLLFHLASLHYTQRDYARALEALERAAREPALAFEVFRLRGLIHYEMEKLELAVAAWKQALALRADAELQNWLERAEREARAATGYQETGSRRFTLRYSGEAAASPRLVREVFDMLEREFDNFSSQFNYLPREPIVVLLYTNEAFTSVTGAPIWVDAVHDGKIRVPAQGLSSLTPRLRDVLRHELSHAFIQEKSRNRAPRWLHEGLGQWFEGARSSRDADLLQRVAAGGRLPLAGIEASIYGASFEEVAMGYALALAVVETMLDLYRMNGINRLLEELARGASLDTALTAAYRMNSAQLEEVVLDSLRRRYPR